MFREMFVGGGEVGFFILTQYVEGADQTDVLAGFHRQVESAETKECFIICKRERGFDAFLVNFHAEDGEIGICSSETGGAFEGGARVKAVAEVNEQGRGEPPIGPREKRGFVEQEKIVNPAKSVGGSLAARGLPQRGFWFLEAGWRRCAGRDSGLNDRSPVSVMV